MELPTINKTKESNNHYDKLKKENEQLKVFLKQLMEKGELDNCIENAEILPVKELHDKKAIIIPVSDNFINNNKIDLQPELKSIIKPNQMFSFLSNNNYNDNILNPQSDIINNNKDKNKEHIVLTSLDKNDRQTCLLEANKNDWWVLVDYEDADVNKEKLDEEYKNIEDEYVIIDDKELNNSINEFVSEIFAKRPELINMSPEAYSNALKFNQEKYKKSTSKSYSIRSLLSWTHWLYSMVGWYSLTARVIQNPYCSRLLFTWVYKAGKWALVLLL